PLPDPPLFPYTTLFRSIFSRVPQIAISSHNEGMPTILLVEDSVEDRKPLAKLLRSKGYEVITASNAFEAMASAQRMDPDLILLRSEEHTSELQSPDHLV